MKTNAYARDVTTSRPPRINKPDNSNLTLFGDKISNQVGPFYSKRV